MNLHNEILLLGSWSKPKKLSHGILFEHKFRQVHMLLIDDRNHIYADNVDMIHEKYVNKIVDEVLILSRHVSKSEIPALSVHAIGLPGILPFGEAGSSGGINGEVVPPSPRFSSLFKILKIIATENGLDREFDITIETTHHGPSLTKPTLYIEIGSTESEWIRKDAAIVWALTISKCLGLDGNEPIGVWAGDGDVMLGIGGGHYAPRHKSIISNTNIWLGHVLANYSLQFDVKTNEKDPSGPWQFAILNAINATKKAFPGGKIFVYLDRKSFKSWQRNAIISYLHNENIPVYRAKQILLLQNNKSSSILGGN